MKHRSTLCAMTVTLAVLFAACGGGASTADSTSTTTTTLAATAPFVMAMQQFGDYLSSTTELVANAAQNPSSSVDVSALRAQCQLVAQHLPYLTAVAVPKNIKPELVADLRSVQSRVGTSLAECETALGGPNTAGVLTSIRDALGAASAVVTRVVAAAEPPRHD